MKFLKLFVIMTCLGAVGTLSTGCKKEEPKPADAIEDAAGAMGDAAKKAGKAAGEAAEEAGDAIEDATD